MYRITVICLMTQFYLSFHWTKKINWKNLRLPHRFSTLCTAVTSYWPVHKETVVSAAQAKFLFLRDVKFYRHKHCSSALIINTSKTEKNLHHVRTLWRKSHLTRPFSCATSIVKWIKKSGNTFCINLGNSHGNIVSWKPDILLHLSSS
jgi:hypothetical protein